MSQATTTTLLLIVLSTLTESQTPGYASTPESMIASLLSAFPAFVNAGQVPELIELGNASLCGPFEFDVENAFKTTVYKAATCIQFENLIAKTPVLSANAEFGLIAMSVSLRVRQGGGETSIKASVNVVENDYIATWIRTLKKGSYVHSFIIQWLASFISKKIEEALAPMLV